MSDPVLTGGIVSDPTLAGTIYGGQGPAGPANVPKSYPVAIARAGQTVIPLPIPPSFLSSLRLIVNGSLYAAPDLVLGATTITWANPDFILEPGDAVTLSYV